MSSLSEEADRPRGSLRSRAAALDAAHPLPPVAVTEFPPLPDATLYLDGNSLGRLPMRTSARLGEAVTHEWGHGLVRSWEHWIDLPSRVGDLLAEGFLGARPGEVAITDSTTVNLYKLAHAALRDGLARDRDVVLTDAANFPTDRYVLAGLVRDLGAELVVLSLDSIGGPSAEAVADELRRRSDLANRLALVSFSHVDYRSGALADMAAINRVAHRAGALALWDLSHSVGAVPVDLTGDADETGTGAGSGADLAVGCTYKYLNGGPGAPAFLYVRREHQKRLRQPVQGWFGQRDQFAMAPEYDPAPGIDGFLTGTTPVLGAIAVETSGGLLSEIGIGRLRERSMALTGWLIDLTDAMLAPLGFTVATPRDARRRGGHVALRHPDAYRISRALTEQARVIGDFREPDLLRLAPVAASTTYTDVWDACSRIRDLVERGAHLRLDTRRSRVT